MQKAFTVLVLVCAGWFGFVSISTASEEFSIEDHTTGGGERAQVTAKCKPGDWDKVKLIAGQVDSVVDGDTIKLRVGKEIYNIRFLSIDTPETHYFGKSQGYWGDAAAANLAKLLPVGSHVKVELEEDRCDKYGRILGHVWFGKVNTNYEQVRAGFAVNYCIFPNIDFCKAYGKAATANEKSQRGIFSDPNLELPYEWRRLESKRPHEKYIGNVNTGDVFRPGALDRVPVGERVFFTDPSDVAPPYHTVE